MSFYGAMIKYHHNRDHETLGVGKYDITWDFGQSE